MGRGSGGGGEGLEVMGEVEVWAWVEGGVQWVGWVSVGRLP